MSTAVSSFISRIRWYILWLTCCLQPDERLALSSLFLCSCYPDLSNYFNRVGYPTRYFWGCQPNNIGTTEYWLTLNPSLPLTLVPESAPEWECQVQRESRSTKKRLKPRKPRAKDHAWHPGFRALCSRDDRASWSHHIQKGGGSIAKCPKPESWRWTLGWLSSFGALCKMPQSREASHKAPSAIQHAKTIAAASIVLVYLVCFLFKQVERQALCD